MDKGLKPDSGCSRLNRSSEAGWPENAEILFIINISKSLAMSSLVLSLQSRQSKKLGDWKAPGPLSLAGSQILSVPHDEDREILNAHIGGKQVYSYGQLGCYDRVADSFHLSSFLARTPVPSVVRSGRCFMPDQTDMGNRFPLSLDEGEPWNFVLEMHEHPGQGWRLRGSLRRAEERTDLASPVLVTFVGFLFTAIRASTIADTAAFPWIAGLRKKNSIGIPVEDPDA